MQRILSILLVLAVCVTPTFADAIIGQDLQKAMNTERGELTIIVSLKKDVNASSVRSTDKAQILSVVAQQCASDQHFVKSLCDKLQSEGSITEMIQFSMSNCIGMKATSAAVQELALHSDIYSIALDAPQMMIDPIKSEGIERGNTWGLRHIRADQNKGYNGSGITVAVVDTGIQMNHPGFAPGQIVKSLSKSFVDGEASPNDGNGHGTHCAGTIGSPEYGVAPGCKIFAVRVLGSNGSGTWQAVAEGVEYAAKHADAISMSLGGTESWTPNPVEGAVETATAAGVPCLIAAGNSGSASGTVGTPGCVKEVITVGAIAEGGSIAYFSSRGPTKKGHIKPDICAPGVNVKSLWINSGTNSISGTSMATPHVAGLTAVLLSANSGMGPQAIKRVLMNTAKGTKQDNVYGRGCVDTPDALNATLTLMEMGVNTRGDMNTMRMEKKINVNIVDGKVNFSKNIDAPFSVTIVGLKADFSADALITLDGKVMKNGRVQAGVKEKLSVKISGGNHDIVGTATNSSKKSGTGTITVYISIW